MCRTKIRHRFGADRFARTLKQPMFCIVHTPLVRLGVFCLDARKMRSTRR